MLLDDDDQVAAYLMTVDRDEDGDPATIYIEIEFFGDRSQDECKELFQLLYVECMSRQV